MKRFQYSIKKRISRVSQFFLDEPNRMFRHRISSSQQSNFNALSLISHVEEDAIVNIFRQRLDWDFLACVSSHEEETPQATHTNANPTATENKIRHGELSLLMIFTKYRLLLLSANSII